MSLANKLYHLLEGDVDFDEVDDFMESNNIEMEKIDVEDILSIVTKTMNDWNRTKKYKADQVTEVVELAIKDGLIELQDY
jgi:hypothetical protein